MSKVADIRSPAPDAEKANRVARLKRRHEAFSARLSEACDLNPTVPTKGFGRFVWLRDRMEAMGHSVTTQTIHKWFSADTEPRPPKMEVLAEILGVDLLWLQTGTDPTITPRERRARNAMADGVVNLVAGLIQMDGATPVFPAEDDRLAERENVDIYATIKAVQYRFHIALAEKSAGALLFRVPPRIDNVMVIGVERVEGFDFRLYEIPGSIIEDSASRRGGSLEIAVSNPAKQLRAITSFAERF